jgi:hypothetical protein
MSTSLKPPVAAAPAALLVEAALDSVAEEDADADADAELLISWRTARLAGTAAARGARTKRPLRMVETLGMLMD